MSKSNFNNDASALNLDGMGVCVKNEAQAVVFQNEVCATICGDQIGALCRECVSEFDTGSVQGEIQQIRSHLCDFHKFSDRKKSTMTVFYVADQHFNYFRNLFKKKKFTPQETEIGFLLLQRLSNAMITKKLFISVSTLKTHLNHMYQKCPELKQVRRS